MAGPHSLLSFLQVETRWDVTPTGDGTTCHIVVHLGIPFSKGTMWKSFIEKGTTDTTNEAVATFKRLVRGSAL